MEELKFKMKNEEALYKSLIYYRLKRDLELIEKKIEDNGPKDSNLETNVFKKGLNTIGNTFKRSHVRDLSESKKIALDNLSNFECENGKNYDKTIDELKEMVRDVFKSDKNQEAKIMMSLGLALSSEYTITNEKETLEEISLILFEVNEKINDLVNEFKNNYYKIRRQDIKNLDKDDYQGLGIAAVASLFLGPIGLKIAKENNENVAKALEDAAKTKGVGKIAFTISALTMNVLLFSATAGTYAKYEIRKDAELKKEFRNVTPDNLAIRFAVKALLIEELKRREDIDLEPYLDDALQLLDDYRADSEYMMIVEKLDARSAKEKISICNNLSERLQEIVGI